MTILQQHIPRLLHAVKPLQIEAFVFLSINKAELLYCVYISSLSTLENSLHQSLQVYVSIEKNYKKDKLYKTMVRREYIDTSTHRLTN